MPRCSSVNHIWVPDSSGSARLAHARVITLCASPDMVNANAKVKTGVGENLYPPPKLQGGVRGIGPEGPEYLRRADPFARIFDDVERPAKACSRRRYAGVCTWYLAISRPRQPALRGIHCGLCRNSEARSFLADRRISREIPKKRLPGIRPCARRRK